MTSDPFISQASTQLRGNLFAEYATDTRSERRKFMDEALSTINNERRGTKWPQMNERQIALMVNTMAPKEGGDALVVDIRKECNLAKSYGQKFWWLYNEARSVDK